MNQSILINTDKLVFLKATQGADSVSRLTIWAEILCPNDNFIITGLDNRDYSVFTLVELKVLYRNTTGDDLLNDHYLRTLQSIVKLASNLDNDDTSEDELYNKLGRPMPSKTCKPAPEKKVSKQSTKRSASKSGALPTRPKAGSTTAKVWDICDTILKSENEDYTSKQFRNLVIQTCVDNGINKATAQVQFSKWKKVQLGSN